jgi:hypothetical protein
MLRIMSVIFTDVSGHPIGPTLTLENYTDKQSQNVGEQVFLSQMTFSKLHTLINLRAEYGVL